jgi:hypothetical protein
VEKILKIFWRIVEAICAFSLTIIILLIFSRNFPPDVLFFAVGITGVLLLVKEGLGYFSRKERV